jgi:glyoxylase-like metal-dependent hydrolase (beta-lactamase superfamily II)
MDGTNGLTESSPVASSKLSLNVFTAPGKAMVGERPRPFGEALGFDPMTSTLIFGHSARPFPRCRAIATPKALNAMQMSFTPLVERLARRMFPGQVATKLVAPEPYEHDTFTLEGHELRIIEQGRTDSPDSTSLYVPSIGLIVAGDVVYNECHMYVGDTTPESRKNWIADLDRLAALNPAIVVAGHKKPGAPDSPSAIQETKRYLEDFDRLQKTATSDHDLFDQMTALYPDWVANQSWLMFGFPGA